MFQWSKIKKEGDKYSQQQPTSIHHTHSLGSVQGPGQRGGVIRKPVLTASFLEGLTYRERSGTAREEGQPHGFTIHSWTIRSPEVTAIFFDYSALLGPNLSFIKDTFPEETGQNTPPLNIPFLPPAWINQPLQVTIFNWPQSDLVLSTLTFCPPNRTNLPHTHK